jgi:ArsR family metal-binding transcriptional regulator
LDTDIGKAIEKRKRIQETHEGLPQINCGACGAPTCLSFAEDVVLGRAPLEDCVVLAARQARTTARASHDLAGDPQVITQ